MRHDPTSEWKEKKAYFAKKGAGAQLKLRFGREKEGGNVQTKKNRRDGHRAKPRRGGKEIFWDSRERVAVVGGVTKRRKKKHRQEGKLRKRHYWGRT